MIILLSRAGIVAQCARRSPASIRNPVESCLAQPSYEHSLIVVLG